MGKRDTAKDMSVQATARLRHAGLRPTGAGVKVSLATVYNTLHQFTQAGLLRQVIVDAARSYFDTNTGDHQHFFLEDEGMLIDIPGEDIQVANVPAPPPGLSVDRVDVVVRVRRN